MSEICEFYNSSKIFITGGTGFLGKILIEKLLYSTDVAVIFILIREKKEKSVQQRLIEMFDNVMFDRLKQKKPNFYERVVPINGDCQLAGLGLKMADRERLIANVNIVFHVAATVRFDEHIKLAYEINVQGTKSMLDVAKQMKNLKIFIHVSTAYSHCHLTEIDEKFYDVSIDHDELHHLLNKLSLDEAEKITPKLLGNYPNTYTFTKGLAENLINQNSENLPISIFRPSIILPTYREPIIGWSDNFNGLMGGSASVATGHLHLIKCNEYKVTNMVPVDMCASALIAIGWNDANNPKPRPFDQKNPIYNYVSSPENPITWADFLIFINCFTQFYPYVDLVWPPYLNATTNSYIYNISNFFLLILPSFLLDFIAFISGFKQRFKKMSNHIRKSNNLTEYFTMKEWKFSNKNTQNLWNKLNDEDHKIFQFNMNELSWVLYFSQYVKGIRIYLLNDSMETLPLARTKLKKLIIIRTVTAYLFYFGIGWILCYLINVKTC